MFKSVNYIDSVFDIPATWIFENYLNIPYSIDEYKVKIHSIFNDKDSNPSMFIYYNPEINEHRFKCFSTGRQGSAIDMLMEYWELSFGETAYKIMNDYTDYLKSGGRHNVIEKQRSFNGKSLSSKLKWIVSNHKIRKWNTWDKGYWTQYQIGSKILEEHDVYPLEWFEMSLINEDGEIEDSFIVEQGLIYGYFDKKKLIKIYQPLKKQKFIKVDDYILGNNQRKGLKKLIIASSLKDIISLKLLKLRVDIIAPDSENTMLSKVFIEKLKSEYDKICTLLDSDIPGVKAMEKYKEVYGFPYIFTPLAKDPSEMIKVYGLKNTYNHIYPKVKETFLNYKQ